MRLVALLLVAGFGRSAWADEKNIVLNDCFESNLQSWAKKGEVAIWRMSPLQGEASARIGPSTGSISQRLKVGGLRIIYFSALIKTSGISVGAAISVRCCDAGNHVVMRMTQEIDAKKAAGAGDKPGIYLKTHAFTKSIVVTIEKTSSAPGYVTADAAVAYDYDRENKEHKPECDLDQYMLPFWKSSTIYDETVLMLSENGKPAIGKLLFKPSRILSVKDSSLKQVYSPDTDYLIEGNAIVRKSNSKLPQMKDKEFETGDLKWYSVNGKHIKVTYSHEDQWPGPIPSFAGNALTHTVDKLTKRSPLVVAAIGDSITLGIGTSGNSGKPPYMPTWAELAVRRLKQVYGYADVQLYNVALGGMTSDWGRDNIESAVATLKPDLVLIAFGMNDFWWMPQEQFRENTRTMMSLVQAKNPNVEFLLIASMRFDPAYAQDPQYRERMASYTTALRSLTGKGVAMLDMDSISGSLANLKKPKDLISDPLHPNDFLARWYAQGIVAILREEKSKSVSNIGSK